jgi:tRNA (guanosine-2'-O-)-methyltransferase
MRLRASLCAMALLTACLEVPAPRAKDALDVKDVKGPAGVGLETACTPTGSEMCFDARDNNCNGVIDEGCGLHTGILQFAIAWESAEADVDLNVHDATGDLAAPPGQTTSGGLIKDKDCPKQCHGQNVENVYLAEGDPRRGRYRVVIRLDKLNGATAPVRVRFGARVGQRWFGMNVDLSPGSGTEERSFEFTL